MTTHELKTWPEYFAPTAAGVKTFEVRRDDRGFRVGDRLRLREFEPGGRDSHDGGPLEICIASVGLGEGHTVTSERYTGSEVTVVVTYILRVEDAPWIVLPVDGGHVAMAIRLEIDPPEGLTA